jgi:hypothetical protein
MQCIKHRVLLRDRYCEDDVALFGTNHVPQAKA